MLFSSDFTADLQLDREGRYRFTYVGKLTDVSMAQRLVRGDLQGINLQKRIEIAERDMRRDNSFKEIQYEEKGALQHQISARGLHCRRTLLRFRSPEFAVPDAEVQSEHRRDCFNRRQTERETGQRAGGSGIEFNGVLRVWTNAEPDKHNSKKVETRGRLIVYSWNIENIASRFRSSNSNLSRFSSEAA